MVVAQGRRGGKTFGCCGSTQQLLKRGGGLLFGAFQLWGKASSFGRGSRVRAPGEVQAW